MFTQPLEEAIASTRSVLGNVTAGQLDDPTPCESWKVRDVINHVVGTQHYFVGALTGTTPADGDPASGDFVAAFDGATGELLEAFRAEGVADRLITLPFGEIPGAAVAGVVATDTFTHGWDLARATGQPTDLAPDLAAALLANAQTAISDAFRGPDGKALFGQKQETPDTASNADRLAAFLGRTI
ncbi:MAG TPA: TIGR03086 family metal-binding protein [Ilumatobacteraceae bacterium]|nr:TIGR03086 family metal-binding protein [Ilumatobacteraceae bacterium]